jgi:hypothetical protein
MRKEEIEGRKAEVKGGFPVSYQQTPPLFAQHGNTPAKQPATR